MGMIHYLTWQKIAGVKVVAICSRDPGKRAGDWTAIRGNFGPVGTMMDLSGIKVFDSYDGMLSEDDIDLIDITLPPSMHADASIRALNFGKHVLCEKPLSLDVASCDAIRAAASRANRKLLVAHVLPYFPEYAWALKEVRSGKYGKLLGGSFERVIADPAWLSNYWSAEQIGGPLFDLHVHDAHFIRSLFGMPTKVVTDGSMRGELLEHWHSQFDFQDPDLRVHATSGVIDQPDRPFLHGFEIRMERVSLKFEFAITGGQANYSCVPTLLTNDGQVKHPEFGDGDPMLAFESELRHVVDVIAKEAKLGPLDSILARDAIEICQRQLEAIK